MYLLLVIHNIFDEVKKPLTFMIFLCDIYVFNRTFYNKLFSFMNNLTASISVYKAFPVFLKKFTIFLCQMVPDYLNI